MSAAKMTSLQKMQYALTEAGWQYETKETPVAVPDPDGRRGAIKYVEGYTVAASNEAEAGLDWERRSFTVEFTKDGKFLAPNTKGQYPFQSYESLTNMVKKVAFYSLTSQQERRARREQEAANDFAKEQEAVAASYREAVTKAKTAKEAATEWMVDRLGMTFEQANEVLASAADDEIGKIFAYVAAKGEVDRAGRGWGTGKTYIRGTYKDGVLVGD